MPALEVAAPTIPTDRPESHGTLEWDSTTIIVVESRADGAAGLRCGRLTPDRSRPGLRLELRT